MSPSTFDFNEDKGDTDDHTDTFNSSDDGDDEEENCSWMKDSDVTWLESWWSKNSDQKTGREGCHSVKSRLTKRNRSNSDQISLDSKDSVAISQNVNIRRCQFASISTIDISQHVTEQQSARDFYDVTLHAPLGLGMNLSVSMSGRVVVASLIRLSNGQHSPAQLCGLIAPLDVMIGINGINIEQMDLQQTTEVLKTLERLGKENVRLRFRYGDPAVPLPLRDLHVDDSKEVIERVNSDDPLTAESFADQLFSGIMMSPEGPKFNPQAQQHSGDSAFASPVLSSGVFQGPLVDMLLNSDLTGFGLNGGSEGDHAQLMASLRRGGGRPTTVTAEMIQGDIRSNHKYPVAARVTCMHNFASEDSLLHELAQEVFEWRPYAMSAHRAGFFDRDDCSVLMRTPRDTGRYKYTQQLEWSDEEGCYVAVSRDTSNKELDEQNHDEKGKSRRSRKSRGRNVFKAIRLFTGSVVNNERNLDQKLQSRTNINGGSAPSSRPTSYRSLYDTSPSALHPGVDLISRISHSTSSGDIRVAPTDETSPAVYDDIRSLAQQSSVRLAATHSRHQAAQQQHFVSSVVSQRVASSHHVITARHDEVRNMLRCEPDAIINELLYSLDNNYNEYKQQLRGEGGKTNSFRQQQQSSAHRVASTPRHYETGIEVHLPPYDITYLLFYAVLYKLTLVLLTDSRIVVVLRKWMDLFNPDSILQTKQTHSAVRSAPPALPGSTTSGSKYDFLIYYNNALSTVTNIKGYLEVISDLLTLYFLLNTGREHLSIASDSRSSGSPDTAAVKGFVKAEPASTSRKVSAVVLSKPPPPVSRTAGYCRMFYIPLVVNFSPFVGEGGLATSWGDATTSAFVNQYRELLQLDICAALCCARRLYLSVEYLLAITSANEPFVDASVLFKELVSRTTTNNNISRSAYNPLSSAQYILDRCGESVHSEFNLMFCLYLRHIAQVFRTNEQLAVELSLLYFPHSTPWMVRYFIFGEANHKNIFVPLSVVFKRPPEDSEQQTFRRSVSSNRVPIDPETFFASHCKYHVYLTRLMTTSSPPHLKMLCADQRLMSEWLQSCLYLDAFQRIRDTTTPLLPCLVTAGGILKSPVGLYSLDLLQCVEICCEYRYLEGVLVFVPQWLHSTRKLEVLVLSELTQFLQRGGLDSVEMHDAAVETEVDHIIMDNGSILRIQDLVLLCFQSAAMRLVEPAVTANKATEFSHAFSDILHSQSCELLRLLQLVMMCAETSSDKDDALTALLCDLETCRQARRYVRTSKIERRIMCHQKAQKAVLVKLVALMRPVIKNVLDYAIHAFQSETSDSLLQSSVTPSARSPFKKRDLMVSVSCELSLVFVHALGLSHGLVVACSQSALKTHLTEQFYSIAKDCPNNSL